MNPHQIMIEEAMHICPQKYSVTVDIRGLAEIPMYVSAV